MGMQCFTRTAQCELVATAWVRPEQNPKIGFRRDPEMYVINGRNATLDNILKLLPNKRLRMPVLGLRYRRNVQRNPDTFGRVESAFNRRRSSGSSNDNSVIHP